MQLIKKYWFIPVALVLWTYFAFQLDNPILFAIVVATAVIGSAVGWALKKAAHKN